MNPWVWTKSRAPATCGEPPAEAGGLERGHGLAGEVARPAVLEAPAGQVLEHRERQPLVFAHVQDANDVRVPEPHQRLNLAGEPLGELLGARPVRARDLDHHVGLEVVVPRTVYDAHPALAEPFEQFVPPAQPGARVGVGRLVHGDSARAAVGTRRVLTALTL